MLQCNVFNKNVWQCVTKPCMGFSCHFWYVHWAVTICIGPAVKMVSVWRYFPLWEKKCVGGMSNVHCSRLMRKSQIWEIWEWARFSTGRGTARPLGGKNILINAEHSNINKNGIWVLYVSLITNYQTRHPVFTLCPIQMLISIIDFRPTLI